MEGIAMKEKIQKILDELQGLKEEAVSGQNFSLAAMLRDTRDRLAEESKKLDISITKNVPRKPHLTMKSNEYFQAFYVDGKSIYGREPDNDIVYVLEEIAAHCPDGFTFEYAGDLSEKEMDNFQ
jgi:hypothetical protein